MRKRVVYASELCTLRPSDQNVMTAFIAQGWAWPGFHGNWQWICHGVALCLALANTSLFAVVRINEVQVTASEYEGARLADGTIRLGAAPGWFEADYDPALQGDWTSGAGPFGFGASGVKKNLSAIQGATPSAYLRKVITVSSGVAQRGGPLKVTVDYSDGFVLYLNGREVLRKYTGGEHMPAPRDLVGLGTRSPGSVQGFNVGIANNLLVPGQNVLAVQLHNNDIDDGTLLFKSRWQAFDTSGNAAMLADYGATWQVHLGTAPPSGGLASNTPGEDFDDFIELYNDAGSAVSLTGWTLSDNVDRPDKWRFPAGAQIPAHGYFVVRCTGRDQDGETNFRLKRGGEWIQLNDANGNLVSAVNPNYASQSAMLVHGWDEAAGGHRVLDHVTPGAANRTDTAWVGVLPKPTFSLDPGFYEGQQNLVIRSLEPHAEVRYTTDGSVPTSTSPLYTGPLTISQSTAVRARAFKPGWIASAPKSRSILIDVPPALRGVRALSIVADEDESLYRPNGVCAVVGGSYNANKQWVSGGPDTYSLAMMRGRAFERPVSLEMMDPADTEQWTQRDIGLRIAGSRYTRPRYVLSDLTGLWNLHTHHKKPYFNAYFRNDYDNDEHLDHAWLPLKPDKKRFEKIRIRGGKNDWQNPFLNDELVRRLFHHMGQPAALGIMSTLWVNGEYKAYFNPCERYSETFFQHHFGSTNAWDVINHNWSIYGPEDGDLVAYRDFAAWYRETDFMVRANYETLLQRLEIDNYIDYVLLSEWIGVRDWPENNWYASRERIPEGRWRFHFWDAEMSFGFNGPGVTERDNIADLLNGGGYNHALFQAVYRSPEFKLRFADRVNKHLFNNGALEQDAIQAAYDELEAKVAPLISHLFGQAVTTKTQNWIHQRRPTVLSQLRNHGLWPSLAPPAFSQPGGSVPEEFRLTMTAPSGGTIHFTLDGTDPRLLGGAVAPGASTYGGAVALPGSGFVRARVRKNGAWSALTEGLFVFPPPDSLRITEIMYHPTVPEGEPDEPAEFIELKNVGGQIIDLAECRVSGIGYTFPADTSLGAGQRLVLAADSDRFAAEHPGVSLFGEFAGKLSNDGERIQVLDPYEQVMTEVRYRDNGAWPELADGGGHSLVPTETNPAQDQDGPAHWQASCAPGGSPGLDDPVDGDLAPAFYNHPDSQALPLGAEPEFRALAWGCPRPSYQWYRNHQLIAGGDPARVDRGRRFAPKTTETCITASRVAPSVSRPVATRS